MDEIALKLIERYHQNALSPEEEREFQRRIISDTDFAKEVHCHGLALDAIRLEGEKELRRRLTMKGKDIDAKASKHSNSFAWQRRIFLVIVLGLGIWLIYAEKAKKAPALFPTSSEKSIPVPPSSPKSLAPAQPQAQTKTTSIDSKKVFAAYFGPYRDASLEPSVRGNVEEISPQEHFRHLYWEGEYAASLIAFDSLNTFAQQDNTNLFLKANCLLHAGQGNAAAELLEGIIQNGRSRFVEQVPWYLAMCRLQRGDWKGAERLLLQIAQDANSPRQVDAKRLLSENKSK